MKRFSRLSRSALSTTALLVLLSGCGGSSSTITSLPVQVENTNVQSSQAGVFTLSEPISAVSAAGLLQIQVTTEEPTPAQIQVGEIAFVKLPLQLQPQTSTYVAPPEASLEPIPAGISTLEIGTVQQARISTSQGPAEATALIYQGDLNTVTFEDYVLVRALGLLPPGSRSAEDIATRANELFAPGNFTAGALNPVPDETNTDYVDGGSTPPPDLEDALAVYAAFLLPPSERTAANIAAVINTLSPDSAVTADDIRSIPGEGLPGGIIVTPAVGPIIAGEIQISVQIPSFPAPSFTIESANFVQQPGAPFPGFTSYLADAASSLIEIEFGQISIPGLPPNACVVVHTPGTDPNLPGNQIATSAGCSSTPTPTPLPGEVLNEPFDNANGFTQSTAFFSDGSFDFFGISDGMGGGDFGGDPIPTVPAYTGVTDNFLVGSDLDGEGATLPIVLEWQGLNISGLSNLRFSGDFAEDPFGGSGGSGPDQADFILVEAQIDGGGFQRVIEFRGDQEFNGSLREDTNGDGVGDGPIALDLEAQTFVKSIAGTGSTLDLRLTLQLDAGFEDFAIDDFIIDVGSIPTPSPTPTPPGGITIPEIQGASQTSPFVTIDLANLPPDTDEINGDIVTTTGIITALDFSGEEGFFLQDPVGDGDDATSDAIFVFTEQDPDGFAVGDEVQVTGTVSEFFPGDTDTRNLPTTRIINPQITTMSTGNPLPTPVVIGTGGRVPPDMEINTGSDLTNFDPDTDGIDFFESLESMLVTAQNTQAIAGTNQFGEIFTVVDNGAGASGISQRGTLNISPDDFNPEKVQVDEDSGVFNFDFPEVTVGAQLGAVTGVISYSFGNFEILPTEDFTPGLTDGNLQPQISSLSPGPDQLTIASYNVLNLDPKVEDISLVDDQDEDEIDDDLGDGRFDQIASHIVTNLNAPDIIGLQEVQDNDGAEITTVTSADVTLQTLITAIENAGGPTYAFIDNPEVLPIPDAVNTERPTGGQPGGNIRVAFLYNPSRVSVGAVTPLAMAEDTDMPGNTFFEARIPLAAEFMFNGNTFTVVNNHFSSKSGSAPILGVVQPFDELQEDLSVNGSLDERQAQATVVRDFVDAIPDPMANVVVLGDLNEFEFVSPVSTILGASLTNLIDTLPEDERYSFIFQGNSQQLDHILVSDSLLGANVDNVHVNTEFPVTPSRGSDHDPVLASFNLTTTSFLTPGDVQILGFQNRLGEAFSFVTWVDLPAGTQISFTDDSVDRNDQFLEGEPNVLIWEADQMIPAGTVVVIDAANGTADTGMVVQSPVGPFTAFGDQLFAFQGSKLIENLIFGLNFGNEGWLDQAFIVTPSRSFLPTTIDSEDGNIDAGAVNTARRGEYSGDRQNAGTVEGYQDLIYLNNLPIADNWVFTDAFFVVNLDSTDFNLSE